MRVRGPSSGASRNVSRVASQIRAARSMNDVQSDPAPPPTASSHAAAIRDRETFGMSSSTPSANR